MDKIYTGFGPLTPLTDPNEASITLGIFRDIARSKQAQSLNQMSADAQNKATAEQAKTWIDGGRYNLIALGGPHYNSLDSDRKEKLLDYYLKKLSETGLFSNREASIDAAFRLLPGLLPVNGAKKIQMAINIIKEELKDVQSAAQASTQSASQQPTGQQAAAKEQVAPSAPAAQTPAQSASQQPTGQQAAAKEQVAPSPAAQTPAQSASQQPTGQQAAAKGQEPKKDYSSAGLLGLIGQGLSVVLDAIKKMPSAPKVSDAVLAQMIVADKPQYWFPNNQVEKSGFYGPFVRGQNIFWAEVEYSDQGQQFVYSGRYASVPTSASQAVQESVAQGN